MSQAVATTKGQAVAKTHDDAIRALDDMLDRPDVTKAFDRASAGKGESVKMLVKQVYRADKQLAMKCTMRSIIEAAIEAATYGIPVGGPKALAYMVPYGDQATLIIGYRGYIELGRAADSIANVLFGVVHEQDKFEITGPVTNREVIHEPAMDQGRVDRPVTHVWCVYELTNGKSVVHWMSQAAIDKHKERYAKGWKKSDSAWQTSWESMAIKTVLKQPILKGQVSITKLIDQMIVREGEVEGMVHDVQETAVVNTEQPLLQEQELVPEDPFANDKETVRVEFDKCTSLDSVNKLHSRFEQGWFDEDEMTQFVDEVAEEAKDRIRGTRGENSNTESQER